MGRLDAWRSVHRNCNAAPRPVDRIVCQSLVHDFHSVHFLTGSKIVEVHGSGGRPIGDSFRHIAAVCRTDSGLQAIVEFDDCGFAYEVLVDVLGEHGDAATGAPLRAVRRRDGAVQTVIGPDWFAYFADAYRIQDAAWVASIRAGTAVGPSTWDGFLSQAVVDAVLESFATGRTVRGAGVRDALDLLLKGCALGRSRGDADELEGVDVLGVDLGSQVRPRLLGGGPLGRGDAELALVALGHGDPDLVDPAATCRRGSGRGSRGSRAWCASRPARGRGARPAAARCRAGGPAGPDAGHHRSCGPV